MDAEQSRASRRTGFTEFLSVGGATLLLLPLGWLAQAIFGRSGPELVVGFSAFYGAHLINDPHFSATYLLFYERWKERAFGSEFSTPQRLRYWFAGVCIPLTLCIWGVWAIANGSSAALGALMELMFLLVGWHYVKQGFGVFSVLCARRGVRLEARARRALLFHCLAGWLFAWVNPSRKSIEVFEKGVVYWSLARPALLEDVALVLFTLSAGAAGLALLRLWWSNRPRPPLAALCGLLVSVWSWTVFSAVDPLLVYTIPALHSLQYLYFVHLLRKSRAKEDEGPPNFGAPASHALWRFAASALLLGWLLFHAAPSVFDTLLVNKATRVGPTPYFAALFAIINIHHYFMDAVIWRRDNPETRYLLH